MSNYPPGVTGREFAIAGPDWDGEIDRTCDNTHVTVAVFNEEARGLIHQLKVYTETGYVGNPEWLPTMLKKLDAIEGYCYELEMDTCPFEGEVSAWAYGGVLHWECPVCGKEYEEDGRDD